MVLSGAGMLNSEEDIAGYFVENLSTSSEEDVPQTSSSKGTQPSGMELTESRSGIGWKFANQGKSPIKSLRVSINECFRSQPP